MPSLKELFQKLLEASLLCPCMLGALSHQLFYVAYLFGSEGVHIVSTIRGHQLSYIISPTRGSSNKANPPHQLSTS